MRTLLPSEVEPIRVSIPTKNVKDPSLGSHCLKKLGERLRASYDVVDEPLPVRLKLDRLGRHQRRDRRAKPQSLRRLAGSRNSQFRAEPRAVQPVRS